MFIPIDLFLDVFQFMNVRTQGPIFIKPYYKAKLSTRVSVYYSRVQNELTTSWVWFYELSNLSAMHNGISMDGSHLAIISCCYVWQAFEFSKETFSSRSMNKISRQVYVQCGSLSFDPSGLKNWYTFVFSSYLVPDPPQNLIISEIGEDTAMLSWADPAEINLDIDDVVMTTMPATKTVICKSWDIIEIIWMQLVLFCAFLVHRHIFQMGTSDAKSTLTWFQGSDTNKQCMGEQIPLPSLSYTKYCMHMKYINP